MGQKEIRIDNDQAINFARVIYSDISAYIQSHQEEYQSFLQQHEQKGNEKNETTY